MAGILGRLARIGLAAVIALITGTASAQTVSSQVGLDALMLRLGAGNTPTGATVVVGQVEAPEPSSSYGPNQGLGEFSGKAFTAMSGPPGNSGHATTVAQNFYSNTNSIAPGITSIFLYEASSWVGIGFLQAATPPPVAPGSIKIFNNSWIAGSGGANNLLRRADFVANRDELLMVNGVANFPPAANLMYECINCLTVGLTSGTHLTGTTSATTDVPGRMKPELVAPGQFTSFATPVVAAAGALMTQTAKQATGLSTNPNAVRNEVLKAVMLCGASRNATWTNNPSTSGATRGTTATPLDPTYGAGLVYVDTAHLILTGLEQNTSVTPPTTPNATYRGWDYIGSTGPGVSRYWRFHIANTAPKVAIAAVWNRYVEIDMNSFLHPNVDIQLWKVNASNQLVSMVGAGGVGVFTSGNVVSQSAVDNVELLDIRGLAPGDYTLELKRNDAINLIWDVSVAWLFPKPGDITGNGAVNIDDLLAVINAWGNCPVPSNCPPDQNGDGVVNIDDLLIVINNWG